MVTLYFGEYADGVQGSRLLLERALRDRGLPPMPLCHGPRGEPRLETGPEISLSHTRGAAALALGDRPVGVDIERVRPVGNKLAQRVMSPSELQWFREQGETKTAFFTLWTLKESYYKYLRTGLPGFPNSTEFRLEDGHWRLEGSPLRFEVYRENLLFVALCCEEQEVTLPGRS